MIFIGTLFGFIRSIWKGLKDPEFRALFFLVVILLLMRHDLLHESGKMGFAGCHLFLRHHPDHHRFW